MKHILLITTAFFFGLSSLADHEGKKREEITYEDIREHITPDMREAFYLYMAEEKKHPYYMQNLGIAYHSRGRSKDSSFPQDYWKAVKWKMRYIESRGCPPQATRSLYSILRENKKDEVDPFGRPEDVELDEVVSLLYAMEVIKFKQYLRRIPSEWDTISEHPQLDNKELLRSDREGYNEVVTGLESKMTEEQIKEAYLEVERLENLLGDALYDESLCKTGKYYSTEDQHRDNVEFLLEKGYIKVVE